MLSNVIREKINSFLSPQNVDDLVQQAVYEEVKLVLKDSKDEINLMYTEAVRGALESLKQEKSLIDTAKLKPMLDESLELAIELYEAEIQESLGNSLLKELKNVKFFPRD